MNINEVSIITAMKLRYITCEHSLLLLMYLNTNIIIKYAST